jgi:hypothetical protein
MEYTNSYHFSGPNQPLQLRVLTFFCFVTDRKTHQEWIAEKISEMNRGR